MSVIRGLILLGLTFLLISPLYLTAVGLMALCFCIWLFATKLPVIKNLQRPINFLEGLNCFVLGVMELLVIFSLVVKVDQTSGIVPLFTQIILVCFFVLYGKYCLFPSLLIFAERKVSPVLRRVLLWPSMALLLFPHFEAYVDFKVKTKLRGAVLNTLGELDLFSFSNTPKIILLPIYCFYLCFNEQVKEFKKSRISLWSNHNAIILNSLGPVFLSVLFLVFAGSNGFFLYISASYLFQSVVLYGAVKGN